MKPVRAPQAAVPSTTSNPCAIRAVYHGRNSMKTIPVAISVAMLLAACSATKQEVVKASADEKAPAVYRVDFDTSRGPFVVEVPRAQAPKGADHFYSLVKAQYFDGARFYRVVPGFMVQWGSAADPKVSAEWDKSIPDD